MTLNCHNQPKIESKAMKKTIPLIFATCFSLLSANLVRAELVNPTVSGEVTDSKNMPLPLGSAVKFDIIGYSDINDYKDVTRRNAYEGVTSHGLMTNTKPLSRAGLKFCQDYGASKGMKIKSISTQFSLVTSTGKGLTPYEVSASTTIKYNKAKSGRVYTFPDCRMYYSLKLDANKQLTGTNLMSISAGAMVGVEGISHERVGDVVVRSDYNGRRIDKLLSVQVNNIEF